MKYMSFVQHTSDYHENAVFTDSVLYKTHILHIVLRGMK